LYDPATGDRFPIIDGAGNSIDGVLLGVLERD
jgi:hypothetical protein